MRTTLTIDDDLLAAAKTLARAKSVSVGTVLCDLARLGLKTRTETCQRGNFPVFPVSFDARPITLEDVKKLEEEA